MPALAIEETEVVAAPVENPGPRRLKGYLARCSRGRLGLITEDLPREVTYPDGSKGLAYVGVHLGPTQLGQPWSSRNPQVERPTSERSYRMLCYMLERSRRRR